ncbi:MAG: phosphoenolpyruvate carboxykinase (ATP) [Dasania sp.]
MYNSYNIQALKTLGVTEIFANLQTEALYEKSIQAGEAKLAKGGALVAETGEHTGRSAEDKFTVRDAETENTVWWGSNKSITPEAFDLLEADFTAHMKNKSLYMQELFGGADLTHRLPVRIVSELAWHSLFIRHLLRRPEKTELANFQADFTVINLPSFKADPKKYGIRSETVIAVNFTKKLILIGGTSYAGETKKSVFSILNYLLPTKNVMPMHCSVNVDNAGENSAVFFGLSGTGKTTLSADASRVLIGDDEHGWSENGLFNFEGGCYAKTIRLSPEAEPEIYNAVNSYGAILENVVLNDERIPDFDDATLAENSRGAYPLDFIPNASETGRTVAPKTVIMLTADAFGILPPIAKMSPNQAMYHFLSGYTAKVAGTEKGVKEPTATFSTCFGAPFMPRHPSEYGNLLKKLIAENNVSCYLVNTGWTGGAYGTGNRMPIKATRALLNAALDGSLDKAEMRTDVNFGFQVPVSVANVDSKILDPRSTWADPKAYDAQAEKLVKMFIDNFVKYENHISDDVKSEALSV